MTSVSSTLARLANSIFRGNGKGLVSAATWQIANYAVPLLTFPYLGRVLGVEGFGAMGFAAAVAAYAGLIADWGFSLSATQSASENRHDRAYLNRLVWSVTAAKVVLGVVAAMLIVAALKLWGASASTNNAIYAGLAIACIGACNIEWLLRGLEKLKLFATISVASRVATVPLTYIFVTKKTDIVLAVIISGAGSAISLLIGLFCCIRMGIINTPQTSFGDVALRIKDGFHLFLSQLSVNIYTTSLTVILGFFSSAYQVGLFSGADKLRRPALAVFSPTQMVFFPRISYLAKAEPEKAKRLALRILVVQAVGSAVVSALLALLAPFLVTILLGAEFADAVPVLRVLSLLVFLIGCSSVLGLIIMLPFDLKREFNNCVLIGAVVGVGAAVPLSIEAGAFGLAWAAVAAEFAVAMSMFVVLSIRFSWISDLWRRK